MFANGDAMLLDVVPRGRRRGGAVVIDWDSLDERLQLMLAGAALRRAAAMISFQAETLAREIEAGGLEDRGGAEALRLLATVVRVAAEEGLGSAITA